MTERAYERFCPLARALDVLGERWTLLVVQELARAPRRFSELHERLSGIGANLLSARLRRLQEAGAVRRRALPAPGGGTVYELTERGRELRPALRALSRWGAGVLAMTHAEDAGATASYRPASAAGDGPPLTSEWRVGEHRFALRSSGGSDAPSGAAAGRVVQTSGPAQAPDLVVELKLATLERIAVGQLGWEDAHAQGLVELRGSAAAFHCLLALLGAAARPPGARAGPA